MPRVFAGEKHGMTASKLVAGFVLVAALILPVAAPAQTVIDAWPAATTPPAPQLKTVRIDPKKTVLFIADFNKKSCTTEVRPRCAAALPKIRAFLGEARLHGVMVVHFYNVVMTRDDLAIAPLQGELVLQAPIDKFYGNDVAKIMVDRGIDTVVLAGTSANGAVLFTAGGAAVRGFKVVVPVDGMPADGLYQEQFTAWEIANAPTVSGAATLSRWDLIGF